jgi:hypothetical protein
MASTGMVTACEYGVEALSGRATGITAVTVMVIVDFATLPSESVTLVVDEATVPEKASRGTKSTSCGAGFTV